MEDNENEELTNQMEQKPQDEQEAEQEEMAKMTSFGQAEDADKEFGDKPTGMPLYKEPLGAFDPPDVPGLDPNDIPEDMRTPLRGNNPETPADTAEEEDKPNTPEEEILQQKEVPEEILKRQEKAAEPLKENAEAVEKEIPPAPPKEKAAAPAEETAHSPAADDPIFCPSCGKQLYVKEINGQKFYCHTDDQDTDCEESFSSIEEIENILKRKEERKKALEEAKEAEKKREEPEANTADQASSSAAASGETPAQIPSAVFVVFTSQLNSIVKTLAEIQAKEAKMDALQSDITAIKKQLDELKEAQTEVNLPQVAETLSSTSEKLSQLETDLKKNLASSLEVNNIIQELKQASRDLLLVTDNAGQQFYQFMNSVKSLEKYANRVKYLLPQIEEYLKDLEACYENLAKRYSKEQKLFADHFKKQTQDFFKEASKRFVFQKSGDGSINMLYLILPTIIAFVVMLIVRILK